MGELQGHDVYNLEMVIANRLILLIKANTGIHTEISTIDALVARKAHCLSILQNIISSFASWNEQPVFVDKVLLRVSNDFICIT